jgi:hypothetical protein
MTARGGNARVRPALPGGGVRKTAQVSCIAVALLVAASMPALAAAPLSPSRNSVFLFGGAMTTGTFGGSLTPFYAPFDGTGIAGAALDHRLWNLGPYFHVSGELGSAARFGPGEDPSLELWTGVGLYYNGVTLGPVTIGAGLVGGFSVVTGPTAVERQREIKIDGSATFLGYLSPEIDITFASHPNLQIVYGLHHRSGAWQTFGNMGEGANADVIGIRHTF